MPTYTFLGQTPDDGTYEVGEGPFPDLPAGTYEGNFYGNDPSLGLIRAGDQRYSLPDSSEDASSSGNTFQVGTGPQPGLPAGRFLPGEVKSFFRDQARAAEAATRAAQPPPPQVSPTPTAGSAVPAQTTLPNPVTPVAVPTFVPSTGLPNFGSSNLLAQTGVPGATGGLPNVPNIVSPLEPLLATSIPGASSTVPSTLPATGTSVPNIGSNLGLQSVFTQLFPSVPDISQTPLATVAHGGPILASDSLPGYQVGGDVSDPDHGINPRSPFRRFQGTNVGTDPYYADEGELEIFLNQGFTLQDIFGSGYTDRMNRYTGRTITPRAHGGPILASDYLNAGGPVQYFQSGSGVMTAIEAAVASDPVADAAAAAAAETVAGQVSADQQVTPLPPKTTGLPFGGRTDITEEEASRITPEIFDALSLEQLAAFRANSAITIAIPPQVGLSKRGTAVSLALGAKESPDVQQAIAGSLLSPAAQAAFSANNPGAGFFIGGNAEGGPIMASERLNAGGPVQYFSNGGGSLAENTAEAEASAALGTLAPGIGSVTVGPSLATPIEVVPAPPLDLDVPEDPLTTPRIGPFSILDFLRTAAGIAIPGLAPVNAAITAFEALNALNKGQTPPGVAGFVTNAVDKLGIDLPGFLEGTLDIETPENPAEQGSVFSDTFGNFEDGPSGVIPK
jgi:hypothetical protein